MAEMKINSINLNVVWSYASKNTDCICSRPLHMPTANEIQKKVISRNNVITGECGHTFHKECIEQYCKNNTIGDTEVHLCPFDHLQWKQHKKETLVAKPEYYLY